MGLKNKGSAPVAGSDDLATTAYVDAAAADLAPYARLGTPTVDMSGGDLNNLVTTGFYRGAGMINQPIADGGWYYVLSQAHDTFSNGWQQQTAWGYTSGGANRMFWRYRAGGVWQPWREVAPVASPAFTGTPTAPTATTGDSSTTIATTAYVQNVVGFYLPKSGGTITGNLTIAANTFAWNLYGSGTGDLAVNGNGFQVTLTGTQILSTTIRARTETAASGWAGGGTANGGTAVGSTTAFVTVNTSGVLGRLDGSPRFPTVYSDVITTRAVNVGSTGQLGTASSARRTKNVHGEVDFDDAQLERWLAFPTVEFDYKADAEHKAQVGVIAEDVLEADPAFTTLIYYDETLDDPETKIDGFAYERMAVWNRMAIKRLLARVKDLEARIPA